MNLSNIFNIQDTIPRTFDIVRDTLQKSSHEVFDSLKTILWNIEGFQQILLFLILLVTVIIVIISIFVFKKYLFKKINKNHEEQDVNSTDLKDEYLKITNLFNTIKTQLEEITKVLHNRSNTIKEFEESIKKKPLPLNERVIKQEDKITSLFGSFSDVKSLLNEPTEIEKKENTKPSPKEYDNPLQKLLSFWHGEAIQRINTTTKFQNNTEVENYFRENNIEIRVCKIHDSGRTIIIYNFENSKELLILPMIGYPLGITARKYYRTDTNGSDDKKVKKIIKEAKSDLDSNELLVKGVLEYE